MLKAKTIERLIWLAFYFGILFSITSCHPQKRMAKLMDKQPGIAAVECSERFPVIETTDTTFVQDTALLLAYEQEFAYINHLLDSLLAAGCDTVTIEKIKELRVQMPSKPCPEKIVTITKENTARVEALRLQLVTVHSAWGKKYKAIEVQLSDTMEKNYRLRNQRNTYLWLFLLLLVWTFRKPLLKVIRLLTVKI